MTRSRSLVLRAALLMGTAALLPVADAAAQSIEGRASALTVGGRLQVQYATSSVDEAVDDVFLRRARFEVDGDFTERLDGRLQVDFGGGAASVKDAYVRYQVSPGLRVTAGQFKRPFSVFELASSTDLPIIERDGRVEGLSACPGVGGVCTFSRLAQKLEFDDRDLGLRLDGAIGERVTWYASVTNGAGADAADENDGKSLTGRVEFALTDDVVVSPFVALHDYPGIDDETDRAGAFGADVEVGTWRDGFHLLAAFATGENWQVSDDANFATVQGLASYYVPVEGRLAGVEPLLRVSWASSDVGPGLGDESGLLLTPGVMFYVEGKNGIALNVDVYDGEATDTEWSFKVQTFLYF